MSELDVFFKNIAEGLKSLAEGISEMADKFDKIAEYKAGAEAEEAPKQEDTVKTESSAPEKSSDVKELSDDIEKSKKRKKAKKKSKGDSDTDTVLQIIRRSKSIVSMDTLKKKTGFEGKKIANIVYRLKKEGLIKSPEKGKYEKA